MSEYDVPTIPIPLMALPAGSVYQFLAVTLPLLVVYLYLLSLVITRPDEVESLDDRIPLTNILHAYLVTLVLFSSLAFYLIWFVKKRRNLVAHYRKNGIVILGNVEFGDDSPAPLGFCGKLRKCWVCRRLFPLASGDYGYATYNLEKVANHPACSVSKPEKLVGKIRKKVRVFHRYSREQISIVVLPDRPYSGQPKVDLEADWASFSEEVGDIIDGGCCNNGIDSTDSDQDGYTTPIVRAIQRDRMLGVLIITAFWISFCFFAALYTCFQIGEIEEYYDDESATFAWVTLGIMVGVVTPLVAVGGNWLRWMQYSRWMLRSGKKVKDGVVVSGVEEEAGKGGEASAEAGADYIQMT